MAKRRHQQRRQCRQGGAGSDGGSTIIFNGPVFVHIEQGVAKAPRGPLRFLVRVASGLTVRAVTLMLLPYVPAIDELIVQLRDLLT
jgi:hypothetical protein